MQNALKVIVDCFQNEKILVFKVEVIRLKVLGSRTRQGREGERGYWIQLCKTLLVAFDLSET